MAGKPIRVWSEEEKNILRETFFYDEKRGLCSIVSGASPKFHIINPDYKRYLAISIKLLGKWRLIRVHHLVWFLVTGEQSLSLIDHIDGDSFNNMYPNLRKASDSQNRANVAPSKGRRYKGTTKSGSKFIAQIYFEGKHEYLGTYENEEDAARAYDKKAKEYHGDFAYLNFPEQA